MSMPVIKCESINKCCAASSLIQSIALQEAGLAHILNAEGEKLQKVINSCGADFDELMEANASVESLIEKITNLEIVLKSKMDSVLPILYACKKRPRRCKCKLID